jgi:hypothetical protein
VAKSALIFNGTNALDFQDIRTNVIRIPEVGLSIREAQSIWDALNSSAFDLANFVSSEDQSFLGHIKLKNFAASVVQVGLLRRYLKHNAMPEFIIGTLNGDSPLKVALEQISFVEMVAESEAIPKERLALVQNSDSMMLAGVRLEEYAVYQKTATGYKRMSFETRDVQKMVEILVKEQGVDKAIFVGPGTWNKNVAGLKVEESIDLDPNLTWFWEHTKENKLAVAN